jgi:GT2 family glycosyltransferase
MAEQTLVGSLARALAPLPSRAVPELAFVMSPSQNWFFGEFVATLRYELEQQGVPSTVHTDGFPEPRPDRVYVLIPPHEYVALQGEEALPDDDLLRRTIFICAEQPNTVHMEQNLELARRAGAVLDINARAVASFRRAGIHARLLRPGYSESLDRFDADAERDLDVLFLGAHTRRRTKWLNRCARILARHNCYLLLSDNSRPNTGASTSFLADAKWDLLTRAKIVLNLHQGEEPYFEWLRVLDAIHAGAVVVTEHSSGMAPLVAGEHLVAATPESLPFVIDAALRDEARLQHLRLQAYERIRTWLPMAQSVSVLRAAAIEIVGRPIPAHPSLGRKPTGKSRLPDPWTPAWSDGDADGAAVRRGLKDARLDLIELRRQVARLEQIVRSEGGELPGTQVVHESPAWRRASSPRVTVVTALFNHAEVIHEALDSVARSRSRDFELVVVDDGSTDGSRDAAAEWMRTHPSIQARLVRHAINRGLGAARNTAVDFARAPYCFILDADNEVYPRCLGILAWALDSMPEVAFAYPMLEVFGMIDAFVAGDGEYILSALGWEPQRLRLGNYIDAMSMIRTERLRELGGFSTDRRLYGWEDYDLWCRMAERGWCGQLVPQILARYRASPSSMLSTTNLSRTMAVATVIEHAPRLMAGILPPV